MHTYMQDTCTRIPINVHLCAADLLGRLWPYNMPMYMHLYQLYTRMYTHMCVCALGTHRLSLWSR